ncbi:MAG: hypothetical protein O3B31_07770 [Chloroflexi bacterium]|nr:hypothetical protein [Chloroflexota bacterium]
MTTAIPPVRTGVAWAGVAVVAAAQLVSWTGLQLAPTLGGPLAVEMSGRDFFAGMPLAVAFFGSAVSALAARRWTAQLRAGRVLAIGAGLGALGCAIAALAEPVQSAPLMVVGVFVEGLGLGWCWLSRYLAPALLGARHARHAFGITIGAAALGAGSGPLTIPALRTLGGDVGLSPSVLPWLLAAALFVALAIAASRVRLDVRAALDRGTPPPLADGEGRALALGSGTLAVLQGAMTAMMGVLPVVVGRAGVADWVVPAMMSTHFLGMFALAPAFAPLIPPRRVLGALTLACLLMAISIAATVLNDTVTARALGLLGVGLAWSVGYVALTVRVNALALPASRRSWQSVNDFVAQTAGGAGALVAGFGFAWAGFSPVAIVCAIAAGAAAVGSGALAGRGMRSRSAAG